MNSLKLHTALLIFLFSPLIGKSQINKPDSINFDLAIDKILKDISKSEKTELNGKALINYLFTKYSNTDVLMDDNTFWALIDKSKANSLNDWSIYHENLISNLNQLDNFTFQKFINTHKIYFKAIYCGEFSDFAYILEDGVRYAYIMALQEVTISLGKTKYYKVLDKKDALARFIKITRKENPFKDYTLLSNLENEFFFLGKKNLKTIQIPTITSESKSIVMEQLSNGIDLHGKETNKKLEKTYPEFYKKFKKRKIE